MISQLRHFGDARYTTSAANFFLDWGNKRVHTIDMTAASRTVVLPDARIQPLRPGGPIFYILNIGANSFNVVSSGGGAVATVGVSKALLLCLRDNSTAAGSWSAMVRDIV